MRPAGSATELEARRRRAAKCFQAGESLRTVADRTWAPRGVTPEQRSWDRRDRLSVNGVVTLSPTRMRVGSYFDVQRENIRAENVVDFLRRLRRKIRRLLILV